MQISVVTPTRNRPDSVQRLLQSIALQSRLPHEVVIVDASDNDGYLDFLQQRFNAFKITIIKSKVRSVCAQRNAGIAASVSEWIFLCDDDIELPPDHFEKLAAYHDLNPDASVICGRLLQWEARGWTWQYPVSGFSDLLWRYFFQLSVWGNVRQVQAPKFLRWLHRRMISFYDKVGNNVSKGGWPIITQWDEPAFRTTTYSLGANMIRRMWLLQSPYDEILDPSGIGDNYGVALGFPEINSIHVLSTTFTYHHREKSNRLTQSLSYYRRILALHYFNRKAGYEFRTKWILWSLVGNGISFLFTLNWRMFRASTKAFFKILLGQNPYWIGKKEGKRIMTPSD